MTPSLDTPRDHHYVPQFYLRNFACDSATRRVRTVGKHGFLAIWSERSIDRIGFERDLYVHYRQGVPVCVETAINRNVETPIAGSDTWTKIVSGRTDSLDRSDKAVLYALIRHLEARNPHYSATGSELAELAARSTAGIPFTEEEREFFSWMRENPDLAKAMYNQMAASLAWTEKSFRGSALSILHSPIPLRSSTAPVIALPAPQHRALDLPLPGMVPYQLVLPLDPRTMASLVLGDFDDAFTNIDVGEDVAKGFNRYAMGHFTHFGHVRHLITDRDGLEEDMRWARYELAQETARKAVFRRRASASS